MTDYNEERILKNQTQSLCNICFHEIHARVVQKRSQVFIQKSCPLHGDFEGLLEKDIDFYLRFAQLKVKGKPFFNGLVIPVTFKCNMSCSFCYTAYQNQADIGLNQLREIIGNFMGRGIYLSGGEPTLREDLFEIISIVKYFGKVCTLVTNGLKLSDKDYVKQLRQAGLDAVLLSFDSFKEETYRLLKISYNNQYDIFKSKKIALENLEKEKIKTQLGITIYPGVNDNEIKDFFIFAMKKRSFVIGLRIRSCVNVGRFGEQKQLFLSELLELFYRQLGLNKKLLLDYFLDKKDDYHNIHHIQFRIRGLIIGESLLPIYCKDNIPNKIISLPYLLKKLGAKQFLKRFIDRLSKGVPLMTCQARIICWPTKENIDLQEVDRGIAHIYGLDKILNFCHAIILLEQQNRRVADK